MMDGRRGGGRRVLGSVRRVRSFRWERGRVWN